MNRAVLLPGVLSDYYRKATRYLLYGIDPAIHASAYEGEHEKTYAEIEFAGKYMDVCSTYAMTAESAEDRGKAKENAAVVARSVREHRRADGYVGGMNAEDEWEGFSVWNMAFTAYGLLSVFEACKDDAALEDAKKILYCVADHFLGHPEIDVLKAFGGGTEHLSILLPAARFYRMTKDARIGEFLAFLRARLVGSPLDFLHFENLLDLQSKKGIEIFVLLIGLCDYGEYTGDREILAGCERYWEQLWQGQIRHDGNGTVKENWYEGGNAPQYLDMESRPSENCVAVGWAEFSVTLYRMTGKIRYLNALDRTLYNHLFGAIDPDGKDFAYYLPNFGKRVTKTPEDMYKCCRYRGYSLFSRIPSALFFPEGGRLTAGVYTGCVYEDDGWKITEKTGYPYHSEVALTVSRKGALGGELRLRIPENTTFLGVTVNGSDIPVTRAEDAVILPVAANTRDAEIVLRLRQLLSVSRGNIGGVPVFSARLGTVLLAAETAPNGDWQTLSADPEAPLIPASDVGAHLSFRYGDTRIVDYASSGRADGREFTVWIKE